MKKKKKLLALTYAKLLDKTTPFAVREAFNQLRTNLLYTVTETDTCPIFAITSVTEASGKSTVISNLALSFAQMGKKVLLVDGDMRCPMIYRFFDMNQKQAGLSELISGISSDVIHKDVRPGLDLITSGRIPPNPSELLTSQRLKELLADWKTQYDFIFFDFPPIGVVADALTICQSVNGYLFDVRSGYNRAKDVLAIMDDMEQVGAKIVGVVLNDYNIKGSGGHYASRYSKYGMHSKYSRYNMPQYEQSSWEQSAEATKKKTADQ